jgi:hypothetical protein
MSSPAYIAPDLVVDSVRPNASAVSWGAIVAGAAAAAALSLILLLLGVGLGLSAVSPWVSEGVSATTFGVSSILWVTFTSLAASAVGGYLAGRLRTKWISVHTDEVYFRDTAHGFLAWAAATLATAALLTTTIGSMLGTGVQATAAVAGGVATTAAAGAAGAAAGAATSDATKPSLDPSAYFVDSLFRRDVNATATGAVVAMPTPQESAASASEVARIFANAIRTGSLPADDQRYVGVLVAQRTGLTPADAEKRVADTFARLQTKLREAEATAKEAADKARKASAYASLWLFISLLAGAFVASLSATYGGRRRDL